MGLKAFLRILLWVGLGALWLGIGFVGKVAYAVYVLSGIEEFELISAVTLGAIIAGIFWIFVAINMAIKLIKAVRDMMDGAFE